MLKAKNNGAPNANRRAILWLLPCYQLGLRGLGDKSHLYKGLTALVISERGHGDL